MWQTKFLIGHMTLVNINYQYYNLFYKLNVSYICNIVINIVNILYDDQCNTMYIEIDLNYCHQLLLSCLKSVIYNKWMNQ